MEVQFTDFENAAFTVFIVLASRVILAFELNLYIPLSQLDENMKRAHELNAAVKQKFFFRRHLANPNKEARHYHAIDAFISAGLYVVSAVLIKISIRPQECSSEGPCAVHDDKNAVAQMTIEEILM